MMNIQHLPARYRSTLYLYIMQGIEPGGFMTAVLSNNLKESFGRADTQSAKDLGEIVGWLYNEIPASMWGGEEMVAQHMQQGGIRNMPNCAYLVELLNKNYTACEGVIL